MQFRPFLGTLKKIVNTKFQFIYNPSSLLNPGVKWFFLGPKCGVTFIFGGKNESRTGEKIKKIQSETSLF